MKMFKIFQLFIVIVVRNCYARKIYPEKDCAKQRAFGNNLISNFKEIQISNENVSEGEFDPDEEIDEQTSTINARGYRFQYDRNKEESDEYKSTLINYPYSVSIQRKGAHYATGALVSENWILTDAREFFNVRESIKLFKARLGSVDCKRDGVLNPLKGVEIHPSYVYNKPSFDLALLRMALPIVFTDVIRPIRLSGRKGNVINAKFLTTYWPRIVVRGQVLPRSAKERVNYNSMRVSTQKFISSANCSKMLELVNEVLDESNLCLKPLVTHHSICVPDVGAPMVAEDGLWGITSSWISPKCPSQPGPTLFTRISLPAVRDWLNTHLVI